ncbi:hypothetical protein DdX_14649 [Ditylenchus destructor]|uniref:Uncharacterized protein n=1 Tax=Ditylenchus destructor TaxID=166010 RepID=A0AAD4MRH4_9BILA|nr:hypothetical protein DdX_14649 [Ditylenchus destructor]
MMNQSIESPDPEIKDGDWIAQLDLKRFEPIGSVAKKHMREMFATADKFLPNARDDEWAEIKEKMSLERFSYWTFLRIFCALLSSEEFRGNHSIPSDTAKEFHNAAGDLKQANYDPYVLYWTGISVSVYYNITSLSVLLLSLDRLLALKFPYRYKGRMEAWVPSVTVITIIGYSVVPIVLYLMALPLELEKVKFCQSQSCTLTRSKSSITMYLRFSTMLANFGISGYLLWLFRAVGNTDRLSNRAVKMTITLEILLNAFPSAVAQIGVSVFDFNFVNHVGPMQSVLITSNIAFCAIYTWSILLRKRGKTNQESTKIVAQIRPIKSMTM